MTTNQVNNARIYDVLSGRNRIINGACEVAQRGTSVAVTASDIYGGPDRFYSANNAAGTQFTQSQGSFTYNSSTKKCITQTTNTAMTTWTGTNYWHGIVQFIEGYNVFDLVGQPFTVSFIFNTNVIGVHSLCLRDSGSAYSYVTSFNVTTANTPTYYSFQIPASTLITIPCSNALGLGVIIDFQNQGTYQSTSGNLNQWQTGNILSAPGAALFSATINNFISVSELQLEVGTIATQFERLSYEQELIKCQRYFQNIAITSCLALTYTANGDTRMDIPLHQSMRIAPTQTWSNTTWTVIAFGFSGSQVNVTVVVSNGGTTVDSLRIILSNYSNLTACGGMAVWGTNTLVNIFANAEY